MNLDTDYDSSQSNMMQAGQSQPSLPSVSAPVQALKQALSTKPKKPATMSGKLAGFIHRKKKKYGKEQV